MRHPARIHAASAALLFLSLAACETPDPYILALYERQSFRVSLLSWSPAEGRIQFEVEILGTPKILDRLTIQVSQHGPEEVELRSDRVTLSLDGLETTGGMQAIASVPMGKVMPEGLGIRVEGEPSAEEVGAFPELVPFLPPSGVPPVVED